MCHKFGCVFYSPTTMTCDYLIITGKCRGCPPTDDCDKYRLTLGDERPLSKRFKPRKITQERLDQMEELFQKYGKNATSVNEFCEKANLSQQLGLGYVRKVHPDAFMLYQCRWDYP